MAVTEPLIDAGLDSLGAMELRDAVASTIDVELPSTVVFDYPSITAMSGFIVSQLHAEHKARDAEAIGEVVLHPGERREAVGLLGSSANTSHEVMRADGALDAITHVPLARWCVDACDDSSQVQARFGSYVEDVDRFDAEIFNVSKSEGVLLDPQQRMLLEATWEAKSNSRRMHSERAGVTVGISGNEYGRMADVVSAYTATGSALSVACGRLSYTFGLQGICMAVDTACSSSLVGSHIAMRSTMSGESDSVTSCGVNVTLSPLTSEMFSKAGMLSKDGRCKTLDKNADGYVRGEACVVLELRTIAGESVDPSTPPCGSFISSAVNQDGRSSSLTAPNGPSQQRVVRSALHTAGMTPNVVDGLEMHGTGTSLGDPIEVGAAHAVLVDFADTARTAPLTISAVKSSIGHTEPASGAVGLLHSVLGVGAENTRGILHLTAVNPHLMSLAHKAMTRAVDTMVLPRQCLAAAVCMSTRPSHRGISSFAFQGTNAHVIVGSAPKAGVRSPTAAVARGRAAARHRERIWLRT
ncbi:MAG: type I polyketide synthase, partial [Promethearchaeia archaeon]